MFGKACFPFIRAGGWLLAEDAIPIVSCDICDVQVDWAILWRRLADSCRSNGRLSQLALTDEESGYKGGMTGSLLAARKNLSADRRTPIPVEEDVRETLFRSATSS